MSHGGATVVALLLDAKWPRPRRIARGRLAMGVETETETRRARGVHCGLHLVPRMAPWALRPRPILVDLYACYKAADCNKYPETKP